MSDSGVTTNGGPVHFEDVSSEASSEVPDIGLKVWRLVLTGGPCGGKTTAQVNYIIEEIKF